ncbi:M42 family metallopeptidase [Blautia argi]|uniref:Peptidase M42 n=1 Tax=Blautia argi TaxID=1912897 RepID=A0A2Z4UCW8_9FIRM|nr:M42 family metallopeptidase [Blautia argi]AWY98923.1 peptidase M42 [Blautia argi]
MNTYTDFILKHLKALLSIDSPTGYTKGVTDYLIKEYKALGYEPEKTVKGGVLVDLGGKDEKNAVFLEAHVDTLGAMVREIKGNGRLALTPLGGMNANNAEGENCRIITRSGKVYEGTCQLCNASVHVNGKYDETQRTFDTVEVLPDEKINTKETPKALGIMTGDIVAFDPRTTHYTKRIYQEPFPGRQIKCSHSPWLCRLFKRRAILLQNVNSIQHFTVYEEVGHGGAASIPEGVTEVLSVDMGCVGDGLECKEYQVSICAKDSGGPYTYEVVSNLIEAAKKANLDFAVDVYPHYGSDAEAALRAGYDVRHGLIGVGVYASHGYERSHVDGMKNAFLLLKSYLG